MRNLKPIFILLVLFGAFHLFYGAIYENHLGEGTDSDVLYPFLFARDFWAGGIRGWNLPPSSGLFPEIGLAILIYPVFPSADSFHYAFGFFFFVMPYFLAKTYGFKKRQSYLFSLVFLALAGILPNSLGQFYFPSFHAVTLLFAAYTLFEINHWDSKNTLQGLRFFLIFSLIWISEYWFFVNVGPFLLIYTILHLRKKSFYPIGLIFLSFGLARVWQLGFRKMGIGVFTSKDLPTMDRIHSAFDLISQDPNLWISGVIQSTTKHSLFYDWFYWYFVLCIIYVLFLFLRLELKKNFLDFVFLLSPILTVVALYIFQIEPNFRYLYLLPFCLFFLIIRLLSIIPVVRSFVSLIIFLGIVFIYNEKYPLLANAIKEGESQRAHRMECLSEFDPNIPGAATYWPIKYSYTYSDKNWTLVPFTKAGVYYPWVSNQTWDKGFEKRPFEDFTWGITENKENLEQWKGVRVVKECEGWFFYKR
ncbi:hypothetical protein EHQ68_16640 [Leptospira congkakensis]|uniref:Glycosyltransferase RgtA/B/C/D-like domain-containing protein n=1 Tax=Leptospira congkakensis TaxID=2484932 RepID=A0A4Z1AG99_9LEPT|nr:hypothetical protein [Leptospira congkakensis]TGL86911.1 hypothetical protein EHQ68_16640 [Leptospira congkakensis]TGL93545.1 hypothetical protein EHQ69_03390 [Leptospira congkakensis]TGL95046.1 hypothetical protein EHQ70_17405 [Leptospira congkakensis]